MQVLLKKKNCLKRYQVFDENDSVVVTSLLRYDYINDENVYRTTNMILEDYHKFFIKQIKLECFLYYYNKKCDNVNKFNIDIC